MKNKATEKLCPTWEFPRPLGVKKNQNKTSGHVIDFTKMNVNTAKMFSQQRKYQQIMNVRNITINRY